jgi:hypothetical protein
LQQQHFEKSTHFACGQYLSDDEAAELFGETKLPLFSYRDNIGHFDSQVGRALCLFVESDKKGLLYINRDPRGRYMVILLKR